MNQRSFGGWAVATTAVTLVVLGVTLVVPRPACASRARVKQPLRPTGVDADAAGMANLMVSGSHGNLKVNARHLNRSARYALSVGGVRVGTFATSRGGAGRVRFSSVPHGRDQLLGVDPRGKTMRVSDENGEDVLVGDMPDDTEDPNAIRCCLPEHDEAECEDLTAEQCQTAGGSNLGAGSCMPTPCAPTPGGDQIRCCAADDGDNSEGAECELSTDARCSEHHGTNLGPGTCEPNPCAPTTPEAIRCCLADHHGDGHTDDGEDAHGDGEQEAPECEALSHDHCLAEGGADIGPGGCEPNPCVGSPSGAFLTGDQSLL